MPEPTQEQMKLFGAMMTLKWLLPLVAIVEIVGGLLIIVPKTRALGAIIILQVMVGVLIHHLVHEGAGMGLALVLFLINVWAI